MLFAEVITQVRGVLQIEAKAEDPTYHAVQIDTYEPEGKGGADYPPVRHIFYGKTEAEARHYMASHKKTDEFFAACFKGKWNDVECKNTKVTMFTVKKSEI